MILSPNYLRALNMKKPSFLFKKEIIHRIRKHINQCHKLEIELTHQNQKTTKERNPKNLQQIYGRITDIDIFLTEHIQKIEELKLAISRNSCIPHSIFMPYAISGKSLAIMSRAYIGLAELQLRSDASDMKKIDSYLAEAMALIESINPTQKDLIENLKQKMQGVTGQILQSLTIS